MGFLDKIIDTMHLGSEDDYDDYDDFEDDDSDVDEDVDVYS